MTSCEFAHLHVHSPFSFLDGASRIEELSSAAAASGVVAVALTDHNNLSGAVRFKEAMQETGVKAIQGAEVTVEGGYHLTILCENRKGYSNLCKILTEAHLENQRLNPEAKLQTLANNCHGLLVLSGCRKGEVASAILQGDYRRAAAVAQNYKRVFGDRFYLELSDWLLPGSGLLNRSLWQLGEELGIGAVVTNNVHYAAKDGFKVHDVLTCVRTGTTLEDVTPDRRPNAENYMKAPKEMVGLIRRNLGEAACARVLENMNSIVEMCSEDVLPSELSFPDFPTGTGERPEQMLRRLVYEGAVERYGAITEKVRARLEYELEVISKLGYTSYFLAVWDLVKFARSNGIRYAGRGSAADSAVAYCLWITEVDSIARGLLFERFLSLERAQKPDIDIDFDARYRDKVFEYVCQKYGTEKVAWVCTYNTFQVRSALREIGKAIGFDEEELDVISKSMPHIPADCVREAIFKFPELRALNISPKKFELLLEMCEKVAGLPKFLGTHLGGIVISGTDIDELAPIQRAAKGVRIIQFDKDDVEKLGLIKIDLLSLRMLSAIEETVIATGVNYNAIPLEDEATFKMIRSGQTVGVFQLESPAQRALQRRLSAGKFEDIVASVALIRPGPIKGNMVDPFIARRQGKEPVKFIDPRLKEVLSKTYGVVLFQEQVIEIARVVAGFTPGEADKLRRVMTHCRSNHGMERIGETFISKAIANGTAPEVARRIFECIRGYASYGFCEAHAAAFANIAIKSAYLACHYPAEYFAALLSSQPMGFYPPSVLVLEARRRGIEMLPPCVNTSCLKFVADGNRIRSSLMVRNMDEKVAMRIMEERCVLPFSGFEDFMERVNPPQDCAFSLILAGAFDGWCQNRRALLWKACGGRGEGVKDFSLAERLAYEYYALGFTVSGHPMTLWRERLAKEGVLQSDQVGLLPDGSSLEVAGFPVRPHRPPTKSGRITVFMCLEDEWGLVDVTVFEDVYQKYGRYIFGDYAGVPLRVLGTLSRRGNGLSVIAQRISPLTLEVHPTFASVLDQCYT
ncbi:MAG: DNA polymerase III subunit alpha [Bacillota bacterium]